MSFVPESFCSSNLSLDDSYSIYASFLTVMSGWAISSFFKNLCKLQVAEKLNKLNSNPGSRYIGMT